LISSVDFGDVIALDVLDAAVHGEPSCEGDRKVIAERAELAALVREVVDELAIFAVLAGEDVFELEDRSV